MAQDVRDTAMEAGSGLLDTIRENPVPAAMAAIGLGWLFTKGRSNGNQQYRMRGNYDYNRARYDQGYYQGYDRGNYGPGGYDRYGRNDQYANYNYGGQQRGGPGEMLENAGEKVGDAAGQVREKVGDVVGTVADTAGNVAGTVAGGVGNVVGGAAGAVGNVAGAVGGAAVGAVSGVGEAAGNVGSGIQQGAHEARNYLQRMLYSNPLAVGAAAVVVGAAIGALLPETEPEHRLMGEAKSTVLDKAQTVAQEAMHRVTEVAQEVGSTIQNETQDSGVTSDYSN
jgi:hypothetical protein